MNGIDVSRIEKQQKIARIITQVITYTFLIIMVLVILTPFYWMLATAVKEASEVDSFPPTLFPKKIYLSNFKEALQSAKFGRYYFNTIFVGVVSTIGTVTTTVLASFAFSRLTFKGRDFCFFVLLATMMIPGEMMVLPNYITVAKLGWMNSYQALIVPFLINVFYIYLLNQNFKQIPNELYYAAKVDGTSDFKYLRRVMIPLAMPTIISITILKTIGAWNAYVWPQLVADKEEWRLISNGLRSAFTDMLSGRTTYNLQMAASVAVTVPLLILFICFRKYIMRGVSRSGIKG